MPTQEHERITSGQVRGIERSARGALRGGEDLGEQRLALRLLRARGLFEQPRIRRDRLPGALRPVCVDRAAQRGLRLLVEPLARGELVPPLARLGPPRRVTGGHAQELLRQRGSHVDQTDTCEPAHDPLPESALTDPLRESALKIEDGRRSCGRLFPIREPTERLLGEPADLAHDLGRAGGLRCALATQHRAEPLIDDREHGGGLAVVDRSGGFGVTGARSGLRLRRRLPPGEDTNRLLRERAELAAERVVRSLRSAVAATEERSDPLAHRRESVATTLATERPERAPQVIDQPSGLLIEEHATESRRGARPVQRVPVRSVPPRAHVAEERGFPNRDGFRQVLALDVAPHRERIELAFGERRSEPRPLLRREARAEGREHAELLAVDAARPRHSAAEPSEASHEPRLARRPPRRATAKQDLAVHVPLPARFPRPPEPLLGAAAEPVREISPRQHAIRRIRTRRRRVDRVRRAGVIFEALRVVRELRVRLIHLVRQHVLCARGPLNRELAIAVLVALDVDDARGVGDQRALRRRHRGHEGVGLLHRRLHGRMPVGLPLGEPPAEGGFHGVEPAPQIRHLDLLEDRLHIAAALELAAQPLRLRGAEATRDGLEQRHEGGLLDRPLRPKQAQEATAPLDVRALARLAHRAIRLHHRLGAAAREEGRGDARDLRRGEAVNQPRERDARRVVRMNAQRVERARDVFGRARRRREAEDRTLGQGPIAIELSQLLAVALVDRAQVPFELPLGLVLRPHLRRQAPRARELLIALPVVRVEQQVRRVPGRVVLGPGGDLLMLGVARRAVLPNDMSGDTVHQPHRRADVRAAHRTDARDHGRAGGLACAGSGGPSRRARHRARCLVLARGDAAGSLCRSGGRRHRGPPRSALVQGRCRGTDTLVCRLGRRSDPRRHRSARLLV